MARRYYTDAKIVGKLAGKTKTEHLVWMLFDTGATHTVFSKTFIEDILEPTSDPETGFVSGTILGVGGEIEAAFYLCERLEWEGFCKTSFVVTGIDSPMFDEIGIQGILGMDVLTQPDEKRNSKQIALVFPDLQVELR